MFPDDYQQIRSLYGDIDGLCKNVEDVDLGGAYEADVRQLVQALTAQQRAPEQIRSFLTHPGVPDDEIDQVLSEPATGRDAGNRSDPF